MRPINFIVVHSTRCKSQWHYEVKKTGQVVPHYPLKESIKHCQGYNKTSVSIAVEDPDINAKDQNKALAKLCKKLIKTCKLSKMDIVAHDALDDEVVCPCVNLYECI